jgi:hypothetical protein
MPFPHYPRHLSDPEIVDGVVFLRRARFRDQSHRSSLARTLVKWSNRKLMPMIFAHAPMKVASRPPHSGRPASGLTS